MVTIVSKKYRKTKKHKRKQIPGIKNTPNDNDEGLMLLQQHKKNQESAQTPWKGNVPKDKTNKNSPNMTDMHMR